MEAAEALTVMPRSRSTASVSRRVISSLASLVAVVVVVVESEDDELSSCIVCIDAEEELLSILVCCTWLLSSVLSIPRSLAVVCRSWPIFPVYSSTRDARLDFP